MTQKPDEVKAPEPSEAAQAAPKPAAPESKGPDYYDQLLRLKAEFENFRKRTDRERPEWVRLGEAGLLERMLPLYDVLLQAHDQVLRLKGGEEKSASKELVQGLELIFKEFNKLFESKGVKVMETVGKPYNHDLHEVLGFVETADKPDGTVMEELQRGYTLQDKVLRPAKVRIAKKSTPQEKEEGI